MTLRLSICMGHCQVVHRDAYLTRGLKTCSNRTGNSRLDREWVREQRDFSLR